MLISISILYFTFAANAQEEKAIQLSTKNGIISATYVGEDKETGEPKFLVARGGGGIVRNEFKPTNPFDGFTYSELKEVLINTEFSDIDLGRKKPIKRAQKVTIVETKKKIISSPVADPFEEANNASSAEIMNVIVGGNQLDQEIMPHDRVSASLNKLQSIIPNPNGVNIEISSCLRKVGASDGAKKRSSN